MILHALFIFVLIQKRTKKIKKAQCFCAQISHTPAELSGQRTNKYKSAIICLAIFF